MDEIESLVIQNLPAVIAERLLEYFVAGKFKIGDRLVEKQLADSFGVSRIPVREALRLLEAQGVVQTLPSRGTVFSDLNSVEIKSILDVRYTIERNALAEITQSYGRTKKLLERLSKIVADMKALDYKNDKWMFNKFDLQYHREIILHCNIRVLGIIWPTLSYGMLHHLNILQATHKNLAHLDIIDDHIRLNEIILDRNIQEIETELYHHIFAFHARLRTS